MLPRSIRNEGSDVITNMMSHTPIRCEFRPCIDIHQGKVKQIVGSTLKDLDDGSAAGEPVTNYESSLPSSFYADLYKKGNLKGGHVIMLDQSEASKEAALSALMHYPLGLQVGGGITNKNAGSYLEAGASHVIVTSHVFRNGNLDLDRLEELVDIVGKDRLVLDLSCRRREEEYYVVTDRWQVFSNMKVDEKTLDNLARFCDEFLVHGVDVEGKRLGIDKTLVGLLGTHSKIPVTYAGGVSNRADLELVRSAGGGRVAVTVGSSLDIFGGDFPFSEVLSWHERVIT